MIIAADFDGTCVKRAFPAVGGEVPGAVDTLRACVAAGDQLILWTCRTEAPLAAAVQWFADRGIPLLGVNANPLSAERWPGFSQGPKVEADVYIDDIAFGCPLVHTYGEKPYVDWRVVAAGLKHLRREHRT